MGGSKEQCQAVFSPSSCECYQWRRSCLGLLVMGGSLSAPSLWLPSLRVSVLRAFIEGVLTVKLTTSRATPSRLHEPRACTLNMPLLQGRSRYYTHKHRILPTRTQGQMADLASGFKTNKSCLLSPPDHHQLMSWFLLAS